MGNGNRAALVPIHAFLRCMLTGSETTGRSVNETQRKDPRKQNRNWPPTPKPWIKSAMSADKGQHYQHGGRQVAPTDPIAHPSLPLATHPYRSLPIPTARYPSLPQQHSFMTTTTKKDLDTHAEKHSKKGPECFGEESYKSARDAKVK